MKLDAVCLLFFSDYLNQHYFFVIFQTAQQLKERLFKSALLFYNISDGAAIQGAIDYLSSIPGTIQVKSGNVGYGGYSDFNQN